MSWDLDSKKIKILHSILTFIICNIYFLLKILKMSKMWVQNIVLGRYLDKVAKMACFLSWRALGCCLQPISQFSVVVSARPPPVMLVPTLMDLAVLRTFPVMDPLMHVHISDDSSPFCCSFEELKSEGLFPRLSSKK